MNKISIKDNFRMFFLLLPVSAFFLLCPFVFFDSDYFYLAVMALMIGVNAVLVVFGLLLKIFDPRKAVSRFLLVIEITVLSELVLFISTNGFAAFGIYGFVLKLLIKDFSIVMVICFYNTHHKEKLINVWFILLLSILNDLVCWYLPGYAVYTFAVLYAAGILLYVKMFRKKQKDGGMFSFAHMLFWGSIMTCSLWMLLIKNETAVLCGFVGVTLATALWNILYLKEIVKNRNDEVKDAEKNLNFKNEEMRVMLSQIKPHFIYNTLNTIQYLCRTDGELAADTISDFSDYLRTNLNFDSNRQIVPFAEELEHVNKYLKIEKLRFKHRLMVKYDIVEEDFYVPTLSLQPIIENAVKHGISKRLNGGTITISTFRDDENYMIQIKDNGVGFTEKERSAKEKNSKRKSLGIKNIENRIETLLEGKLEIVSRKERGTTATIFLPIGKNLEEGEKIENSIY